VLSGNIANDELAIKPATIAYFDESLLYALLKTQEISYKNNFILFVLLRISITNK
jgi:hypothetical protein